MINPPIMLSALTLVFVVWTSLAEGQLYDRLYEDVVSRANKDTIPLRSRDDTLNVTFSVNLIELLSLDTETGAAAFNMWLYMQWQDDRLAWHPPQYDDVSQLRVPNSKLWSPDITLYNGNADGPEFNFVVTSDGEVVQVPKRTVKTYCRPQNSDDTFACFFKFGSWTYNGEQLDLTVHGEGVDLSEYLPHMRWELVDTSSRRNVLYYSCCEEPYVDIVVTLIFRNKRVKSQATN